MNYHELKALARRADSPLDYQIHLGLRGLDIFFLSEIGGDAGGVSRD